MKTGLRALGIILTLGIACDVACKGKPEIGFGVTVPQDLVSQTTWFEIGAFANASCSSVLPMLGGGIPNGAAKRVAFRRDDPVSPTVGDLGSGSYAFASVARGEDCAILATGCTEAEVPNMTRVRKKSRIAVLTIDSPRNVFSLRTFSSSLSNSGDISLNAAMYCSICFTVS